MMCGGFTQGREISEDEMALIQNLREQIEQIAGKQYSEFQPICLKSQVVAGMNYKVKIQVDNGEFIHVKIYKPLPHTGKPCEITDIQLDLNADSEL